MAPYLYEQADWPKFRWDPSSVATILASVHVGQGRLIGRLESLGFPQRNAALVDTLTLDVVKSSEIEGEFLSAEQVRSSVARRLNIDIGGLAPTDRRVEGVVQMTLDATQNFAAPLSAIRLFGWHSALFSGDEQAAAKLRIGAWRDDAKGPMRVVSGALGQERVHYEAPGADRLEREMTAFFDWVNRTGDIDPVLRAALAHLWFVTVHPFDDGNGRIGRAAADWALARSESSPLRFYSMSAQIRRERSAYYSILELVQKGPLDVTDWMLWFLGCLDRAIAGSETALAAVFQKDQFWKRHAAAQINSRQRAVLNRLLDDFEGKLTSTKWAKLCKCSPDTALRDILSLVEQGILVKDPAGGRSTSYSLKVLGGSTVL